MAIISGITITCYYMFIKFAFVCIFSTVLDKYEGLINKRQVYLTALKQLSYSYNLT